MNVSSKFPDIEFLHNSTGSGTVVSSDSHFEGRLSSPNTITIAGKVKGKLEAAEVVIEKEGFVEGDVSAKHLIIIGRFEGKVMADKITIASSGSVKGDLSYCSLTIDDGALLEVSFHKI
ncbi:polymer-forming cytoskeletal protein [Paracoccaceae bacterium]|nr:polymer-forming cytoskeletal protein [Paracoccaceae bacterium]